MSLNRSRSALGGRLERLPNSDATFHTANGRSRRGFRGQTRTAPSMRLPTPGDTQPQGRLPPLMPGVIGNNGSRVLLIENDALSMANSVGGVNNNGAVTARSIRDDGDGDSADFAFDNNLSGKEIEVHKPPQTAGGHRLGW